MKKVALLVLLAILASTMVMALMPTRIVRLTIINKSGYDVYMKLEGSKATDAYYYLTVPAGDRDKPYLSVFTIMSDLYKRTTWQCDGVRSSGNFVVDGNIRLTFTPCGEFQGCFRTWDYGIDHTYTNRCGNDVTFTTLHRNGAGEPRMEKVTYFRWLQRGNPNWANAYVYSGFWNYGCGTWYYRLRTYRLPVGCEWRYQY